MRAIKWLAVVGVVLLTLVAASAFAATFVFGYMACYRPGPNDGLVNASILSLMLALITGFASIGAVAFIFQAVKVFEAAA